MNKITSLSIIAFVGNCLLPQLAKAQLNNNGATIVMGSGAYLVVDDLDFQNNGTFAQTAGTVQFTGSGNTSITGSAQPQFYNLLLNKTSSSLLLQNHITVNNQLSFSSGLLNLNNYNITLDAAASLNGESESSRITGTIGGYVQITSNLNAPSGVNPGNLGAVITSAQNLGSTVIRRGHVSQTNGSGLGSSVFRYYDIVPTNNSALNTTLNFNYFDAELNSLDENALIVATSPNAINWNSKGFDTRNIITNVVTKSGFPDFARVTLTTPLSALPLVWGAFNTKCAESGVVITWKTLQEANTNVFYVRRSKNGRDWQTIATLPAAGNSNSTSTYSYTDPLSFTGAVYRIIQEDRDGMQTLSPVLQSNCTVSDAVSVYPNPLYSSCWVSVQSANSTTVMMRIYDTKGVLVKQQLANVQAGTSQIALQINGLSHGLYNLVISWGNGNRKALKIEKL
ncbi:hypothetical protein A3860_00380 [Niastella vici]|uniref:Secretion system C-terminal sorting domain-containing protein n=1 Tax=Niastella vici TaxID=1703345 RepID=A0A1V9G8G4_9BACT|nr:T9SS type A sorting domain-containing protein [Niastella vici]OQP66860.1 hypothetical protein A3860_00380 [Niastella vici]